MSSYHVVLWRTWFPLQPDLGDAGKLLCPLSCPVLVAGCVQREKRGKYIGICAATAHLKLFLVFLWVRPTSVVFTDQKQGGDNFSVFI